MLRLARIALAGASFSLLALVSGAAQAPDSVVSVTRAGKSLLRVNTDGRVGVGTSTPQERLHVTGLVRTDSGVVFPDGTQQVTRGTLVIQGTSSSTTTEGVGGCRSPYMSAALTITVPVAGTVLVRATTRVQIQNISATQFFFFAITDDGATGCTEVETTPWRFDLVVYQQASATQVQSVVLERPFAVAAGTHTFYIAGEHGPRQGASDFVSGSMSATFIAP